MNLGVSEEFAFVKLSRYRGTVYFNKWFTTTLAAAMELTRNKLFARAAFAKNQHGGVRGRNKIYLPDHRLQAGLLPTSSPYATWLTSSRR